MWRVDGIGPRFTASSRAGRGTPTCSVLDLVVTWSAGRRIELAADGAYDASVETMLETYAGRWGIEVFFRDAKQNLGFADSQARTESAVLPTAPLIGLLYSSLVLWFADGVYSEAIAAPPLRPWYRHKRGLAFVDVLRAAQRALVRSDVLDPRSYSDDLRQSSALRPRSARSQLDPAA